MSLTIPQRFDVDSPVRLASFIMKLQQVRFTVMLCALMCLGTAQAADVPLTLVNPYPATGAVDIAGTTVMSKALRAMQTYANPSTTDALMQHLRRMLVAGLEVDVTVVRNTRGGGEAAAQSVASAAASQMLFAGSGLTADAALDAIGALKPLALVAQVPLVLVSYNEREAGGIAELLQRSRRRPLQIGTPGERSAGHLLVAQMQPYWPRGLAPVAYNGGNGALRGVLARQITLALAPLPAALPYVSNSKLRILTLAAGVRHALLPAVPTFAEAGLPRATASGWHGLFVSSALPVAVFTRWQSTLAVALQTEDAQQSWAALGYVAEFGDAARLQGAVSALARHTPERKAAAAGRQRPDSSGGFTALNIFSRVRS